MEDHVAGLIQRRDRLLAVNARLSVPLTAHPFTQVHATSTEGTLFYLFLLRSLEFQLDSFYIRPF